MSEYSLFGDQELIYIFYSHIELGSPCKNGCTSGCIGPRTEKWKEMRITVAQINRNILPSQIDEDMGLWYPESVIFFVP